jgi:hypothetical protein
MLITFSIIAILEPSPVSLKEEKKEPHVGALPVSGI